MEHTREEYQQAKRQIASTVHKLREALASLEGKPDPSRYKAQITLAKRRIEAFTLALDLIEEALEEQQKEETI